MRITLDQLSWHTKEPRVMRRRRDWIIKLWRIAKPAPGFQREVVRVLRIERSR